MTHSDFAEKVTQPIYTRPRILVADCVNDFRESMEAWQNELLCVLAMPEDPDSALMVASSKRLDAIIIGVEPGSEERAVSLAAKFHKIPDKKNTPVAFVVSSSDSMPIIERLEPSCYVCIEKPLCFDSMAKIVTQLTNFEHFNALIVSGVAPIMARLSGALKEENIVARSTLHPHRYMEFLYDFGPEVLLVDIDLKSPKVVDLCERLNQSKRWATMAIVLFSSSGSDIDEELVEQCKAASVIKLGDYDTAGAVVKTIARQVREKSIESADKDYLTGLPLTNSLYEKYVPLMAESKGSPLTLTLALIDIEHLNAINENAGHGVGDRVLSALSNFLQQRVAETPSMICRWSEDEFVVMLKSTSEAANMLIKNTILDFGLIKIPSYSEPVRLRAGVACFPEDGTSVDALLDLAYWRLHNAKKKPDGVAFD
ncbi:MAG: diguanylate cyclase [Candidatus Melainabacteria bacterium]|nr:diguanylate cyclase [Candidatus Melainabacteria bacterium]